MYVYKGRYDRNQPLGERQKFPKQEKFIYELKIMTLLYRIVNSL